MKQNITDEEKEYLKNEYQTWGTYAQLGRVLQLNPSHPWLALNKDYVTPKMRTELRRRGIGMPEKVRRGGWFDREEADMLDIWRNVLGVSWDDVIRMGISSYIQNAAKTESAKRPIQINDQIIAATGRANPYTYEWVINENET